MNTTRSFLNSSSFSSSYRPSRPEDWQPKTLTDNDLQSIVAARIRESNDGADLDPERDIPNLFSRDWRWKDRAPAPTSLTTNEVETILRWAAKVQGPRVFRQENVEQLLQGLLQAPVRLKTPHGKASLEALRELRLISPYSDDVMHALHRDFGDKHLAKTVVHFKSHMTRGMLPLSWIVSALGARGSSGTRSNKAGQPHVQSLIDHMLRSDSSNAGDRRVGPAPQVSMQEWMMSRVQDALRNGKQIIIDKGSTLINPENVEALKEPVKRGDVRFLVHNRSDERKLSTAFPAGFWGVDFGSSQVKDETEGRFLGLQYALWGAKAVREYWAARPADPDITTQVVGYGQLGSQIVRGMRALGMPAYAITVVDISDEKLRVAAKEGLSTRKLTDSGPRPKRALNFIAVEGEGARLNNQEFQLLGEEQVNFQVGSSNTGLDGVLASSESKPIKDRAMVFRDQTAEAPVVFRDLYVHQRNRKADTHAIFIGENKPINLLEGGWMDATEAVSAGVASAFAETESLAVPGLHSMDYTRQSEIASLFHEHGLSRPKPLENIPDDDPQTLRRDLEHGYQGTL